MYSSDMGQSDHSNMTTDDELFTALASAPPEPEDCLIPNHCKNELEGLEHLTKCLNQRYSSYPFVYMGTLKEVLTEAISPKEVSERRPILIYVNNDKSVSTNLFCKGMLCKDQVIDYLMNNYVFWAWDVTFESNALKLDEMFKTAFRSWSIEKGFNNEAKDKYPMLIGISRDRNGDFVLDRLVEGVRANYNLDGFIRCLNEFKTKFETSEQELKQAKEEARQQMLINLSQTRDLYHRSKHYKDHGFIRSISTFQHHDLERSGGSQSIKYSRLASHHHRMPENLEDIPTTREDFLRSFHRGDLNNESDEADDEDDERTPTVERSQLKFT